MISTDLTFFDTDCLSSFLWVREESIILNIFTGRIVIPKVVMDELSSVEHLYANLQSYIRSGRVAVEDITVGDEAYGYYEKFTLHPDKGYRPIGNGEAAALALAKTKNGIVASNNLRDVKKYVESLDIKHITTADILCEALKRGLIDETQGNRIWAKMIAKRRKLPDNTFSEYLRNK